MGMWGTHEDVIVGWIFGYGVDPESVQADDGGDDGYASD
jgi:hypothetical protein